MKLQILATVAAVLAATPALAVDRTFNDLPAFTGIHIASGIDAVVTVGPAQSVVGSAPGAGDLDELKIEVRDGTLKIWRDWDIFDLFGDMGDRNIRFTITALSLNRAEASSGADVDVSGLSGDKVWLEASSGADLKATDIQATSIDVDASSGADLSANGTCTTHEVTAIIGITGQLTGMAMFGMSEETALAIVGQLMGAPVDELDELALSGIGELANVITGCATTLLTQMGLEVDIAPPVLLQGAGSRMSTAGIQRLVVPLVTSMGTVEAQLAIKEKR